MNYIFEYIPFLILSALVFLIGVKAIKILPIINKLNMPTAVVAALIFLPALRLSESYFSRPIAIPSDLRDLLLIIFFTSMGLAIHFKQAIKGGRPLVIICLLSILLVILQNIVGVGVALIFDQHPSYGLLAGSISYVGGFGSSLAWGTYYAEQGLPLALEVGFSSSTLGLIAGGLFAGPTVAWLINKHNLKATALTEDSPGFESEIQVEQIGGHYFTGYIKCILALIASIYLGIMLKNNLSNLGLNLPSFLCCMLIAITLANLFNLFRFRISEKVIDNLSELSFNSFIILSLLGTNFSKMYEHILPLSIILLLQVVLAAFFASQIIFRFMGKDYEAAVLGGGVIGFGLSSLAVAVATVRTIIKNHGPAPRAFLLTSLVGAALIDLPNNLLIAVLTRFEFFQP
jgi:ESS family glutamate:Na+ symporter